MSYSVSWYEPSEVSFIGPDFVIDTMRKVKQIQRRLKATFDRQKSYADKQRRPLEFSVGDMALLRVSLMKGVMRFGKKGKLAPRHVGPYEIIARVGRVAYELVLPPELASVHPVFHASLLRKCNLGEKYILPIDEIHVDDKLNYEEVLVRRSRGIASVKVVWRNYGVEEATWKLRRK